MFTMMQKMMEQMKPMMENMNPTSEMGSDSQAQGFPFGMMAPCMKMMESGFAMSATPFSEPGEGPFKQQPKKEPGNKP